MTSDRPIARENPVRQLLKGAMVAALPRRAFLVSGPPDTTIAALTFDDGPHPEHTPRVLDVLREQAVSATFFVVGERAAAYPDLVRRIAREGHAVGHHSYTHAAPERTSADELAHEVERTRALLVDLVGNDSTLFRPPLGKVTPAKLARLWRAGQTVILWNMDPKDYACERADQVRAAFHQRPLVAGDIVLLHDTHPHAAEVLPEIVESTRRRGFGFGTVSRWLA